MIPRARLRVGSSRVSRRLISDLIGDSRVWMGNVMRNKLLTGRSTNFAWIERGLGIRVVNSWRGIGAFWI